MEILVCSPLGHFADDVQTTCAHCQRLIVHRPHAPAHLVKLCAHCAAEAMVNSPTEPEVRVTDETLRELALFKAKTRGTQ